MNAKETLKLGMMLVFVFSFATMGFVVLKLFGVEIVGPIVGQIAFLLVLGFSAIAIWEIGGNLNAKR